MTADSTQTDGARDDDPIVVEPKTGDEPEFQKPDHDPHGETQAAAAHSGTSCDDCGQSMLVPTVTLDEASGFIDGVERDVICTDCAE